MAYAVPMVGELYCYNNISSVKWADRDEISANSIVLITSVKPSCYKFLNRKGEIKEFASNDCYLLSKFFFALYEIAEMERCQEEFVGFPN